MAAGTPQQAHPRPGARLPLLDSRQPQAPPAGAQPGVRQRRPRKRLRNRLRDGDAPLARIAGVVVAVQQKLFPVGTVRAAAPVLQPDGGLPKPVRVRIDGVEDGKAERHGRLVVHRRQKAACVVQQAYVKTSDRRRGRREGRARSPSVGVRQDFDVQIRLELQHVDGADAPAVGDEAGDPGIVRRHLEAAEVRRRVARQTEAQLELPRLGANARVRGEPGDPHLAALGPVVDDAHEPGGRKEPRPRPVEGQPGALFGDAPQPAVQRRAAQRVAGQIHRGARAEPGVRRQRRHVRHLVAREVQHPQRPEAGQRREVGHLVVRQPQFLEIGGVLDAVQARDRVQMLPLVAQAAQPVQVAAEDRLVSALPEARTQPSRQRAVGDRHRRLPRRPIQLRRPLGPEERTRGRKRLPKGPRRPNEDRHEGESPPATNAKCPSPHRASPVRGGCRLVGRHGRPSLRQASAGTQWV